MFVVLSFEICCQSRSVLFSLTHLISSVHVCTPVQNVAASVILDK